MSKNIIEDTDKKHAFLSNDEGENEDEYTENLDIESEKNKIVEYSPKGRFIRFNEELGSGAYKIVYKAYDNETGWEVAWNVIRLQRLPDKERKRISDEIALLKQLKHPNIIHFISAWINRQKEEVIFITEAVTGGSLKRYLRKIRTPRLKVIKTWCKEILQGIEYLHTLQPHPIIHRDIKCDNIFINSNKGEIRIGDLGLATFMSHAFADSVLGTPEFMAPEMYDEVYGPAVDIYSFGMCLLEMVTNRTPYEECMNPAQIYRKVSKGIKPNSLNLIGNEEVKNFIIECLKPQDERPTATQLLKSDFLAVLDSELDNQPVLLYEATSLSRIEEVHSVKESMNTIKKEVKSSGSTENPLSARSKQSKADQKETKKEISELSAATSFAKEKSNIQQKSSPQQIQQEEIKKEEGHILGKAQAEDIKDQDYEKKEFSFEQQKADQSSIIQEGSRSLREGLKQPIQEDGRKSSDYEKHPEETVNVSKSSNKEANRYYFVSKGVKNHFLTIIIKREGIESGFDQVVKIAKQKIDMEKIKRKLFQRIDCPNASDSYFIQKLNSLFENLAAEGLLSSGNNTLNHSNMSIHAKSMITESRRSPDKTSVPVIPVYFQPKYFAKFYTKYQKKIPKEYFLIETEEAMNLRHQREMLELENIHLKQKRDMWNRRQNIMSSHPANGIMNNNMHLHGLETDDLHHKVFQINDISYRSEIKKKESRCTGVTTSSVGSAATLSPTCSSGSQIRSISNWGDHKREDMAHGATMEESSCDTDASSNLNADTTPLGHLNFQLNLGNINIPVNPIPSQANHNAVLSAKHVASSFAIQAMRTSPMKTQSDKSSHKAKTPRDFYVKETESKSKRSSIERNLESAQNLAQNLLNTATQSSSQTPMTSITQNISNNAQVDIPQPQAEIEKANKERPLEITNEVKGDKLTVSTKLPLPHKNTEAGAFTKNQQITHAQSEKNISLYPTQKGNLTTPNLGSAGNSKFGQSSTLSNMAQNNFTGTISSSQPNSAIVKNDAPLAFQTSGPNLANSTDIVVPSRVVDGVGIQQKMTITSQNSADNLYSKTSLASATGNPNLNFKCSSSTNISQQGKTEHQSNTSVKLSDVRPSYIKAQSVETVEKIKNYKLSGAIKRHEPVINLEDVKMVQMCLEILTGNEILLNGHFNHYTENLLKAWQESIKIPANGIVDNGVWEKMIDSLGRKLENKALVKDPVYKKDADEIDKEREELKKKMKDKQNKEASECMSKIQSNLIDLSDLK